MTVAGLGHHGPQQLCISAMILSRDRQKPHKILPRQPIQTVRPYKVMLRCPGMVEKGGCKKNTSKTMWGSWERADGLHKRKNSYPSGHQKSGLKERAGSGYPVS